MATARDDPAAPVVTRKSVGLRSARGPVLASLMLSTALVALDTTIIATAVPSIVDDLGGFAQFPWLFSIFLLTQAVSVPVYGKLADLYGRKPIMLLGIAIFLIASVLCGLAWSMPALIAFRALQGLGAGAVQPMSMTIVGDLYSIAERAKVQGYIASMWAMSAVVGPTLGGLISEFTSWRWIFLINIPLCAVAAWMLLRHFTERATPSRPRIDVLGAALLTVGCSLLILGLLEGGQAWAWNSPTSVVILATGVAVLAVFGWAERRAAEPVLPFWLFRHRTILGAGLISLLVGAVLMGLTTYVPTFVQDALGATPVVAGLALATLTIGWPIAASVSGRVYLRIGFRSTALIGAAVTLAGAAPTMWLTGSSSIWQVAACCFVVGLGLGFVAGPALIAAQSSVDWSVRGVVTANTMFARSIGSAIGVAVFGAVANATFGTDPANAGSPTPQLLADASHDVFVVGAVFAAVLIVPVVLLPVRVVEAPAAR